MSHSSDSHSTDSQSLAPIFIVGMPRSGTTLLTSMLSAHPRIAIAPETHYFSYWLQEYKTLDLASSKDFELFWQALSRSQRFSYFGIDANKTRERILSKGPPSHQHILSGWLEEYANNINKPRWGEKTPLHYQSLDHILTWFPNARVIWMLRDPRAVTASLQKVPWASNYIHIHAQQWQASLTRFEQTWQKDARVQLLRYENLVQQPETSLIALCQFLGETYRTDMLIARSETHTPLINRQGWAVQHLESALQPISAHALNKWHHELASHQIEMIDSLTFPAAAKYGYTTHTSNPGPYARFNLNLEKLQVKIDRKLSYWQTKWMKRPKQSGKHIGAAPE
ncbi:sulfotransferase family protein [Leptolyngbya sp. Heron Island J]|uniref:sulfotransferase family protein n=1 Tax=Leptolyngbya sp. Heron Island J TaxID=1385935 RepID=UPI00041C0135|nr:sulfotransferase [Leptolyngbya sp. Heron Island J]